LVAFQFSHGRIQTAGDFGADSGLRVHAHRVAAPLKCSFLVMPMYEFDCDACGERFEDLVAVGTESTVCRVCGASGTHRVLSAPGAPWKLVKTVGAAKQQEVRNAKLHAETKARFKKTRQKAREAKKGGASPGGS
jgi:putative FmdB family regulatory protein